MKRIVATILLAVFLAGFAAAPAWAQEGGTLFLQVDYMKVPHDGAANYIELEKEIYKPIHQARMDRGVMAGWSMYQVLLASPDADYNFVTINVFNNLDHLEGSFPMDLFNEVHPTMNVDQVSERTFSARELVRSELWQFVDAAGDHSNPARYQVINYMSVPADGGGEYYEIEQELWKPMHEMRIEENLMKTWGMYSLLYPNGSAMAYNFATADGYSSLSHSALPVGAAEMRRAYPDITEAAMNMMTMRTGEARTIFKSELWELLDSLGSGGE